MKFSNKTYEIGKWVTQVVLPAIGTLYFTIAGIWGLPAADEVVGTILAVVFFLGVVLGISNVQYNRSDERYDGDVHLFDLDDENKGIKMLFDGDIADMQNKKNISFKVKNSPPPLQ